MVGLLMWILPSVPKDTTCAASEWNDVCTTGSPEQDAYRIEPIGTRGKCVRYHEGLDVKWVHSELERANQPCTDFLFQHVPEMLPFNM